MALTIDSDQILAALDFDFDVEDLEDLQAPGWFAWVAGFVVGVIVVGAGVAAGVAIAT